MMMDKRNYSKSSTFFILLSEMYERIWKIFWKINFQWRQDKEKNGKSYALQNPKWINCCLIFFSFTVYDGENSVIWSLDIEMGFNYCTFAIEAASLLQVQISCTRLYITYMNDKNLIRTKKIYLQNKDRLKMLRILTGNRTTWHMICYFEQKSFNNRFKYSRIT